jgi:hypothetical protein
MTTPKEHSLPEKQGPTFWECLAPWGIHFHPGMSFSMFLSRSEWERSYALWSIYVYEQKKSNKNLMAGTITWKTKWKAKRCAACKNKNNNNNNPSHHRKLSHPQPI